MRKEKSNIKFNYEYRDAANYKNHGSVIFSNPGDVICLPALESQLRETFIDQEFFHAESLSIPSLYFKDRDPELDHDWHHFNSLELTGEPSTDERSIEAFLKEIAYHCYHSYMRSRPKIWQHNLAGLEAGDIDIHTHSDQPTTCPHCGFRTYPLIDLGMFNSAFQLHKCPSQDCGFIFVADEGPDDEFYSG